MFDADGLAYLGVSMLEGMKTVTNVAYKCSVLPLELRGSPARLHFGGDSDLHDRQRGMNDVTFLH